MLIMGNSIQLKWFKDLSILFYFQKKHNVHMYFDKDTGTWVRLPIGWELHHPMVKTLVDQVEVSILSQGLEVMIFE